MLVLIASLQKEEKSQNGKLSSVHSSNICPEMYFNFSHFYWHYEIVHSKGFHHNISIHAYNVLDQILNQMIHLSV
jgi:hypothetical protein